MRNAFAAFWGPSNRTSPPKAFLVMAGDHGVVSDGVSAFPQEVTGEMVKNFLRGGAGINVLARQVGAEVLVVDMGIIPDVDPGPLKAAIGSMYARWAGAPAT